MTSGPQKPTVRACDACKRRKVKCDQGNPCSNCRLSNLSCEHRLPTKRRGPKVTKGRVEDSPVCQDDSTTNLGLHVLPSPRNEDDSGRIDILSPPHITPNQDSPGVMRTTSMSLNTAQEAIQIFNGLVFHITNTIASRTIEDVLTECVDLFLQYIFPNTPIASEQSLRVGVSLLAAPSSLDILLANGEPPMDFARSFTLITALCAFVISATPDYLSPGPRPSPSILMRASKAMLELYHVRDLEDPDPTSLTIRMWHSACMQNTTGRVGASVHYHTEAVCLAQRLRLYEEKSISENTPMVAKLFRANFWLLYLAEKTSLAFGSRLPIIDERLIGEITTLEHGAEDVPFLDPVKKENSNSLEARIFVGFHIKRRIWAAATDLITAMNLHAKSASHISSTLSQNLQRIGKTELMEKYLEYNSLIEEMPHWLWHLNGEMSPADVDTTIAEYQRACFWAQRSNITTTFHCMRLLIFQKSIDLGLADIFGVSDSPFSGTVRKLEIIQDFLHELQLVPFVCFKVQGEVAIDKIRRVGSILLELLNNTEFDGAKKRARSLLGQLLHILTSLDSKASDELSPGWV